MPKSTIFRHCTAYVSSIAHQREGGHFRPRCVRSGRLLLRKVVNRQNSAADGVVTLAALAAAAMASPR